MKKIMCVVKMKLNLVFKASCGPSAVRLVYLHYYIATVSFQNKCVASYCGVHKKSKAVLKLTNLINLYVAT